VSSLHIHIAGINSGLGREIAYQICEEGVFDDVTKISGLCTLPKKRKDELMIPYRGGGLSEDISGISKKYFVSPLLEFYDYKQCSQGILVIEPYDFLILSMGGTAFESYDFSADVTRNLIGKLPSSCKLIICVSAFGVNKGWREQSELGMYGVIEGIGIRGMKDFYLKEVYRSKAEQEDMLKDMESSLILRPKVLTYDNTTSLSRGVSRKMLAQKMIQKMKKYERC
tara:strand:- start:357 stop:1034 length:678 start_codon:yes stop_codon:yes gene_type:complete